MDRPSTSRWSRAEPVRAVRVAGAAPRPPRVVPLGALLKPTITFGRLRTGTVDVGPMTATLSATGTVLPEAERVLASPIDARC